MVGPLKALPVTEHTVGGFTEALACEARESITIGHCSYTYPVIHGLSKKIYAIRIRMWSSIQGQGHGMRMRRDALS